MIGAEESRRIEAGSDLADTADTTGNSTPTSANHATGGITFPICQNVYGKPGALFSVNRFQDARASQGSICVFLFGRAMVWKSRTN